MKSISVLLLLIASLGINAAPAREGIATSPVPAIHNPDMDTANASLTTRGGSSFSCGQYKFDDGTVQEFYSQVWAGIPADRMVCRYFKYEFRGKKGQEGTMVAAKVDAGCTCFFYERPCNPSDGHAEAWTGWMGWQNYAPTDKKFKGWYCFEQS
ncbi:hypothetical protein M3J09_007482 [Ascochyta lentis]